jgi:hypothetical protein
MLPPLALSLSKGLRASNQGFDKLSPNGGFLPLNGGFLQPPGPPGTGREDPRP